MSKAADIKNLRPYEGIAPKKLARRIRSRRARFNRFEMTVPKKAVAKVVAVLEAP